MHRISDYQLKVSKSSIKKPLKTHRHITKHTYTYTYHKLYMHAYIYAPATQGHMVDRFRWGPTNVAWGSAAILSILGYISPHNTTSRVSYPVVNTTEPSPRFLRGDTPLASSCMLDHSDQSSMSTPAMVSTTPKISDIIISWRNVLVRLKSK